jgi:glycine dehydrogenase subunit 2
VAKEIPTGPDGDIDKDALKAAVSEKTAGIMLTNPSTLGVFERDIIAVDDIVRDAGGLLYYDGANLNAILGKVRPGDMGFDVIHMNLHKTFSTPHGGGGPGSGAVGVSERLLPFMPIPVVDRKEVDGETVYDWLTEDDLPQSIGRLSGFMGNAGVLLRAYVYMRMLGRDGMERVAEYATLNANYLAARLRDAGFELAYPERRASHEFIVTLRHEAKELQLTAMDIAKALLDYNFHAPTTYFPLLVPECLLIEPTETESKETLDNFVNAMIDIAERAREDGESFNRRRQGGPPARRALRPRSRVVAGSRPAGRSRKYLPGVYAGNSFELNLARRPWRARIVLRLLGRPASRRYARRSNESPALRPAEYRARVSAW